MSYGIICEYNPFHNGHIYHLNKVKELAKDDVVILVLSGNYTQRGDISIIEKFDKAEIALEYGVDLIVELPFGFATESSDFFAKGAISILNILKCDNLVFGSESNDIDSLINLASIQINNKDYDKLVKEEMNNGVNYPTAMSNALKKVCNTTVKDANDLLALSYIKEIIKNNFDIKPISIKRTNDYNSKKLNGEISSATSIREALRKNKDISNTVPKETKEKIIKCNEDLFFKLLKYKIIDEKDLSIYQTVDEGIDNKLKKEIRNTKTLEELIIKIKSKRYTYNKIKRMLLHILCSHKKNSKKEICYIRVLGFNEKGKKYLNSIKKKIEVPLITNINKNNSKYLEEEIKVDLLYNILTERNDNIFSKKPIIKKD